MFASIAFCFSLLFLEGKKKSLKIPLSHLPRNDYNENDDYFSRFFLFFNTSKSFFSIPTTSIFDMLFKHFNQTVVNSVSQILKDKLQSYTNYALDRKL
eukprot:Pgem_evm1s20108